MSMVITILAMVSDILPHTTENLAMRGKRAHLYYESDGSIVPDDFSHEQTVVFER